MSFWTLTRETTPTARKEHTCTACHATIHPGQEYRRLEGRYGGRWETWKQCSRCVCWIENVAGAYVRPEDVLEKIEDVLEEWGGLPTHVEWDGATMTLYGLEPLGSYATREVIFQASMVPGVGLTEWVKVARTPTDLLAGTEELYELGGGR